MFKYISKIYFAEFYLIQKLFALNPSHTYECQLLQQCHFLPEISIYQMTIVVENT